jgi:hypothetical protein
VLVANMTGIKPEVVWVSSVGPLFGLRASVYALDPSHVPVSKSKPPPRFVTDCPRVFNYYKRT